MSKYYTHTDGELIELFLQGEQAAFAELVERHSGRAYQIAFGILNNKEDAEEVAQDAFLRIYKALPKFRGDSEFTTWMYRIVINLSRNKYRWNKVRGGDKSWSIDVPIENAKGDGYLNVELPDDRMDPSEQLVYSELKNKLMDAMEALPEAYREAVVLRIVKGLSYDEIAELLNCKVGTIKSRIARGREEIRKQLNMID